MLFGDDDSELYFARGNFYSQLLLESLDLSSSAEDERRNHSLKSNRRRADSEKRVLALHLCLYKVDVCTSHMQKKKNRAVFEA